MAWCRHALFLRHDRQAEGHLEGSAAATAIRASTGLCFLRNLWQFRDDMIYLSPAPLYHAAPHMGVNLTIRIGGTAVIMERFDPENFLRLVETHRVTHAHLVPTLFSG